VAASASERCSLRSLALAATKEGEAPLSGPISPTKRLRTVVRNLSQAMRELWRCVATAGRLRWPLVKPGIVRTAALLAGIILGAFVPQAHVLSGAIRWLVTGMLFLVFLQTKVSREAVHRSHFVLLTANIVLGFAAYGLGWIVGGREIALAAFFAGITPTATAAPVVMSFLRGRVDYVVAAFLITNVAIAALLPGILPIVLGRATPDVIAHVAGSVGTVVFLPMIAGSIIRILHPAAAEWPGKLRNVSFGMWVAALFLITANASDFIQRHAETPHVVLAQIAGTSLVVCAANFAIGRMIGGRRFPREASQSLGQKNTTFTIYLALAYASPLVALGPTCYVVWHNLWNSWQLHRAAHSPPEP
jgi:bile acid:Na+ symporter, BASS family